MMAFGGVLLSACYSLQPARPGAVNPGGEIVVRLTDQGRASVATTVGRDASLLRGNLMRRDNGTYVMALTSVEFSGGGSRFFPGDSTRIADADVAELFVNRVSKPRSIIVATAAAIASRYACCTLGHIRQSRGSGSFPPPHSSLRV
jgi:hypothetical protein